MPTALGTFAVGHYVGTYQHLGGSALAWGCIDGPMRLTYTSFEEPIICDQFGDMVVDGVFRGISGRIVVTFKEWNQAVWDAIWPWDTGQTTNPGDKQGFAGLIGRSPTADYGGAITLTPASGSRAATHGPTLITVHHCRIAPGQETSLPLGNVARDIPVAFDVIPVDDGSGASPARLKLWTITQPA